jgi:hypothetical protein
MSPRSKFQALGVLAVAAVALLIPAGVLAGPRFAPLSSRDAAAVERARAGAARRLEAPECRQILSDFKDPAGRTLLDNLETWQQTPSDYLVQAISFLDGSKLENCKKGAVLVTSRGQLPVFVCPDGGPMPGSRFASLAIDKPALAEIMVIHEMLHTLGLGENPPTTFEITDRVTARCGDRALAQRGLSTR